MLKVKEFVEKHKTRIDIVLNILIVVFGLIFWSGFGNCVSLDYVQYITDTYSVSSPEYTCLALACWFMIVVFYWTFESVKFICSHIVIKEDEKKDSE